MKILLIGAGAVGSVLSSMLCKDPCVSKVICASNDLKKAREFLDLKNKKLSLIKLDASNTLQVAKAAKGCNLIINASLPDFNLKIMEAALKAKANYQDLCSLLADLKTAEQLSMHKKFKKKKLVALINAGIAPGITNLIAREIAEKFDKLDEIKIRLIEDQKASEFVYSWSPQVTLDELSAPPLAVRKGKFKLLANFGDAEQYDYPAPFGKRYAVNVYGDEISTIPKYIKLKNADFKSSGTDIDFSKALYKLGLFSSKEIDLNGKKIKPVDFFLKISPAVPSPKEMIRLIKQGVIENAVFASVVEGIGKQSGRNIKIKNTVIYPDLKEISKRFKGATYIAYPTALAAAAFAKIIPNMKNHGVFPPEALDENLRKDVLLELEGNGIVVDEQFSKA
ncbi:saccharopine dehydrogenase NADP-binding domain-containing protein [Candidatus Woesearchaeota archaeon]|nr:saccharopine dehydrogenase NADP-binding domain-containing protein [Candidatus Woesearchaeota archaeon]